MQSVTFFAHVTTRGLQASIFTHFAISVICVAAMTSRSPPALSQSRMEHEAVRVTEVPVIALLAPEMTVMPALFVTLADLQLRRAAMVSAVQALVTVMHFAAVALRADAAVCSVIAPAVLRHAVLAVSFAQPQR